MRKKITLLLIMTCLFYMNGYAQAPFWSDTFEDVGAPSSGVRNAPSAFTTSTDRLFNRVNAAGVTTVSGPYLAGEGTKFWAGEDTDNAQPITAANVLKTVTWTINISGKSNIKLKGLFASGNLGNNAFENGTASSTGVFDYMSMQYSIDGGSVQNLLSFYPLANAASDLYPDTNFDGNGDPASTALGTTFTEFIGTVTGTGTTLTLYMNMSMTSSAEEVAIDNLRLVEIVPCTPPVVTLQPVTRSICATNNTTFPITATGATGYQWQVNTGSGFVDVTNVAPYSGATTNTLTITGATVGMNGYLYRCVTYNPTIACFTNSNSATLNVASALSGSRVVTNVSCFGGTNGAINLTPAGGTTPYTFNWGGGITTEDRTGLAAGTYSVTITDNNGCTATVSGITVTQPAAAVSGTTVVTNTSCFGGTNGAINLTPTGGTSPYTFNWGGGITTEDRTGLAAGTYSVTITDNNGCTGTVSGITVTQPAAVSGTTVVTNTSCFGGTNGAINLTPTGGTGPYTFNWGGGITTEDRTGLAAGTYSVTITDNNGCTGTVSGITVTQPAAAVSGSTVVTNVSCFGGTNGTINLTPTGGTSPYTFNWGGGITTEDRTGLAAGTYSVTITDNN
ncbi:SprB repeat-containing protein, partial [Flavobacterium sp.]|uniref:SprB repeat-containing protein n=1 Tax=Flavobacterium sp. TaxID=239 RepID=UPI00262651D3